MLWKVAPRRGAWIEILPAEAGGERRGMSLPAGERGLKFVIAYGHKGL